MIDDKPYRILWETEVENEWLDDRRFATAIDALAVAAKFEAGFTIVKTVEFVEKADAEQGRTT